MDDNFIKIPKDFESLNDLGDLVQNYELFEKLSRALSTYKQSYVDSFLKTGEEALDYVPASKLKSYKLAVQGLNIGAGSGNSIRFIDIAHTGKPMLKQEANWRGFAGGLYHRNTYETRYGRDDLWEETSLCASLSPAELVRRLAVDRQVLVDTKNKVFDLCYWVNSNSYHSRPLPFTVMVPNTYKDNREERSLGFIPDNSFEFRSRYHDHEIIIDKRSDRLVVKCHYHREHFRSHFGHVSVTTECYMFSTKTNQYVGRNGYGYF